MPLSRRALLLASSVVPVAAVAAAFVHTTSRTQTLRAVQHLLPGARTRDGAGVALTRLVGGASLPALDPFLLLDEFHSRELRDFERGFPTHPHRGFETVTIMWDGEVRHKDSTGTHGVVGAGAVQWMTAGRGILHEEMPQVAAPGGELWGFQLWLNLPAAQKMTRPRYQELGPETFRTTDAGDARARVIAGAIDRVRGPVDGVVVDPLVVELEIPQSGRAHVPIAGDHSACLYVARGAVDIGGAAVSAGTLVVLGGGDGVAVDARDDSRMLLLAARPLGEPIARRGPFVMNTDAELRQAMDDYRSGRLVDG